MHGIGAGDHALVSNEVGGTFSNLCERRLAFELAAQRHPEEATRNLINGIVRVSKRASGQGGLGYITMQGLIEVLASVGLGLTKPEVEILATG